MRRRLDTVWARGGMVLALALALGVVASVGAGALGAHGAHPGSRAPRDLATLLDQGAGLPGLRVAVGRDGKPLLARDGKPLRITRDGKLVTANGRPLVGAGGRPLKLGRHGRVPAQALLGGKHRTARRLRPEGRPGPGSGQAPAAASGRQTVEVGLSYTPADQANQAYAQYGGNLQASDEKAESQAVVDFINGHGGVNGRKLGLRVARSDINTPTDVNQQHQCEAFSQAPRVIATLQSSGSTALPCQTARGIADVSDGLTLGSSSRFGQYPGTEFTPGSLATDRYAAPYVQSLADQGYFARGTRVGLIFAQGTGDDALVSRSLRAALSAQGVTLTDQADLPNLNSAGDVPALVARLASTVVRFRAEGINRVISFDQAGIYLGLFMEAAEPQGYRPRYGISSDNAPNLLRASSGVSVNQFRGAVGMGWSPLTDVSAAEEGAVLATRTRCDGIFRDAGIQLGGRTTAGQYAAYSDCANLLLIQAAFARGGLNDPAATLRRYIESLGASSTSPLTFATRLDGGHHDGASGYRDLAFDEGCTCFRYTGPVRDLGS